jgi:hypothetical protein
MLQKEDECDDGESVQADIVATLAGDSVTKAPPVAKRRR